jgi:hypothetical protein
MSLVHELYALHLKSWTIDVKSFSGVRDLRDNAKPDLLSSSEAGVNPGKRSSKKN